MKLFETRNVFDRVETTWKKIVTKEWQITILPQVCIYLGWAWLGLICMMLGGYYFTPLIPLFAGMKEVSDVLIIIKPVSLFLLGIIILSFAGGIIQTYTLTVCNDSKVGMSYGEILSIAWERLWWWMAYIGWFILILFGVLVLSITLALSTDMWWIFIFIIPWIFWFKIALWPGQAGYVLKNDGKLMPFLQLVKLSYKRWWRIFGNIILTGIIIGSVYSVVQQLLLWISGINDIIVYGVESFFQLEKPWAPTMDWSGFIGKFTVIDIMQMGLAYTIGMVLYVCQQIFLYAFQYTLWQDIETEVIEEQK